MRSQKTLTVETKKRHSQTGLAIQSRYRADLKRLHAKTLDRSGLIKNENLHLTISTHGLLLKLANRSADRLLYPGHVGHHFGSDGFVIFGDCGTQVP